MTSSDYYDMDQISFFANSLSTSETTQKGITLILNKMKSKENQTKNFVHDKKTDSSIQIVRSGRSRYSSNKKILDNKVFIVV